MKRVSQEVGLVESATHALGCRRLARTPSTLRTATWLACSSMMRFCRVQEAGPGRGNGSQKGRSALHSQAKELALTATIPAQIGALNTHLLQNFQLMPATGFTNSPPVQMA